MPVTLEGWEGVARAMGQVPAACEAAALRAGLEAGRALAATTTPRLPVRTGALRASVAVSEVPGGTAVTIGAPYAGYVPAARAMAATAPAAAADYQRRTHAATDSELKRLPWP